MNFRIRHAVLALSLAGWSTAAFAQSVKGQPHLTPWGHPDLQGLWTNSTITPLERPAAFAGREFLTAEEARKLEVAAATQYDQRSDNPLADVNAAYNQFWWERGGTVPTRRTSLVIDPPDGRIPALTPDGQKRAAEVAAAMRGEASGPENRNLAERCITRGAPKLPGGYNNNFQIIQTPTYVAILQEMIHEVRIIPLDGRGHAPKTLRFWLGDSRGRWEGDTLVVETTNYHELSPFNSYNCCRSAGRQHADRGAVPPRGRQHDRPSIHGGGSDHVYAAVHGGGADDEDGRPDFRVRLPRRELRDGRHSPGRARRRSAMKERRGARLLGGSVEALRSEHVAR